MPAVTGWTTIVAPARGGRTLADLRDALLVSTESTTGTAPTSTVTERSPIETAVQSAEATPNLTPPLPSPTGPTVLVEPEADRVGLNLTEPSRPPGNYSVWSQALAKGQTDPVSPIASVSLPPPPPPADRDPGRWEESDLDKVIEQSQSPGSRRNTPIVSPGKELLPAPQSPATGSFELVNPVGSSVIRG